MTDEYQPFPEAELRDLALHALPAVAPVLRNALLSFEAMRDELLLTRTENAQLRRQLYGPPLGVNPELQQMRSIPSSSSKDQT